MSYYTSPVDDGNLTSGFGSRVPPAPGASSNHLGLDFAVPVGSAVVSALPGIVSLLGYSSERGNYITIDHGEGLSTTYQHLQSYGVMQGQKVNEGQKIALSGNSGRSTGPHLHFEMAQDGKPFDPRTYSGREYRNNTGIDMLKEHWLFISVAIVIAAFLRR